MTKILIGVVAVAVIVIVVFMVIDPKLTTNSTQSGAVSEVSDANTFKVTVEGEVSKPGTYTLADGAVMADLIETAGGVTDYADEYAFFEDAELAKGQTYYIASKYDTSNVCAVVELTKVNINEDEVSELTTVASITTSIATSIVSYRNENGQFNTLEDLLEVYGIGNATYRKIRGYCTLHE